MSVKFLDSSAAVTDKPANVVIVAHSAEALEQPPAQLSALLADDALPAIKFAAGLAKPGKESPGTSETLVPLGGDKFQRVAVCLLPSKAASRHCAPGHPHAVADVVGKKKGKGDVSVFLLLRDPATETFSACCAVPRVFPLYSLKTNKSEQPNVTVYTNAGDEIDAAGLGTVKTSELHFIAEGIQEAARLVDAPTNELNVTEYVARAKEFTAGLPGVTVTVIQGEELRERGLGGIYGVGKASDHPPAMVILSHNASGDAAEPSVCMIGKGIVYDTGGLSIKTKTGMPGMKRDMGGSAGILGAFYSIVKAGGLNGGQPLHAVLCMAENAVASNATRPDDVQTFYSGKTVEINNTDAEGRLVMADGLAWATKNLNPSLLLNMATLTGAQGSATGSKHAAVFSNSEEFEALLLRAGRASGDLAHPLPYAPEFFRPEFRSAIADMKNSQKDRSNAGCAAPATFLSNHIEEYLAEDKPWLHIDMAYPVHIGERATGYGVALLFLLSRGMPAAKM